MYNQVVFLFSGAQRFGYYRTWTKSREILNFEGIGRNKEANSTAKTA